MMNLSNAFKSFSSPDESVLCISNLITHCGEISPISHGNIRLTAGYQGSHFLPICLGVIVPISDYMFLFLTGDRIPLRWHPYKSPPRLVSVH